MSVASAETTPLGLSKETVYFAAGAFSGFAEGIAVQPFDMVKTRHQLNNLKNETVFRTMRGIYNEGGIRRFYRGMTAELIGIVPKSSGMYATYEIVYRKLEKVDGYGNSSLSASIAGFISGIPEALIVTPTQVVKVRLQAKEHLGRYHNPLDCIQKVIRDEGFLSVISTGLGPTLWRNCVWNTVYFGTMHYIKQLLPTPTSKIMDLSMTLLSGFCGAVFGTCFNAPFDVVKSRFQSQVKVKGVMPKYRYTIPSLISIYKEEGGLSSCYKGFRPKAIRMGLGGAVSMFVFEVFINICT